MKKVTIEISEESANFLKTLANAIEAQDNRSTAKPYFFVIKSKKWKLVASGYGHGETRTIRVDHENEPRAYESVEEYIENVLPYYFDQKEPKEEDVDFTEPYEVLNYNKEKAVYIEEKAEAIAKLHKQWNRMDEFEEELNDDEEENVFLTETGYQEHVRLNGHNLRRGCTEYYSYLKHAFRNPEMASLFKAIGEFKDAKE